MSNTVDIQVASRRADEKDIAATAGLTDLALGTSNKVHLVFHPTTVQPTLVITSFGTAAFSTDKRVRFDAALTLHHNPPNIALLGAHDRITAANDVSLFTSDINGHWIEENFLPGGTPPGLISVVRRDVLGAGTYLLTVPVGAVKANVILVGGGAGADNTASTAGGYVNKLLTGLIAGNTLNLVVGAGSHGNINGADTVLTSGTQIIGTLRAGGGIKGIVSGSVAVGGSATGGDLNVPGGPAVSNSPGQSMYTGGNPLSTAQYAQWAGGGSSNHNGIPYGGGALGASGGGGPVNGADGVGIIEWSS